MTDPIRLAAEARPLIAGLHGRGDVVVKFKTDQSDYNEDRLDDLDREAPGHFKPDKIVLTLNLDTLVKGKALPEKLSTIEDFRKYPVLAGVAAHESAHAKFSLWGTTLGEPFPETIPNPDFDPEAEPDENGKNPTGPESFPVDEHGKLNDVAHMLEEPRVERLGVGAFTKTWRRAMQLSASHLVLEKIEEDDANGKEPLDAALSMTILVGGRLTAGTLGTTYESRKSVKKVLESAQKIIEASLPDATDPYHEIMGLVSKSVFSNEHTDAVPHLETARQILKIIHPEEEPDPDGDAPGEGEGEGEGEGSGGGSGEGEGESDPAAAAAMAEMAKAMQEAMDGLADAVAAEMPEMIEKDEEKPKGTSLGGHGSVLYNNPEAPQIRRHEAPNAEDRELYKRALGWMEKQIQPTITEYEVGQWLPTGGARLNIRDMVRDDLARHKGSQRTDWERVSETVKAAPPVKVAIMLDGSGSMGSYARMSASIAWAAANAAAMLPESRTVSVVYGDAAAVTQPPGHLPARDIAISNTDGGTEAFIEAAQMVEEALWLGEATEEDQPTNVLIIIVSDLNYGGVHRGTRETQRDGFKRITADWADRGFRTVVVGASPNTRKPGNMGTNFELVKPSELFR